jgi:hypothetical protein
VKRATVTIPDDIGSALDAYLKQQEIDQPLTSVVQAALREFLAGRGFLPKKSKKPFALTPASRGSGRRDTSIDHDTVLVEAAMSKRKSWKG